MSIDVRRRSAAVCFLFAIECACGGNSGGPSGPDTTAPLQASPAAITLTDLGATATLLVFQSGVTLSTNSVHTTTSTQGVVKVDVQSASQSGVFFVVTAVGYGDSTIQISADGTSDRVNVPAHVQPDFPKFNGTFKGEVTWGPQFLSLIAKPLDSYCAGSLSKYAESVVVNLNSAGTGTVTAQDSPGFDRQYPATVPTSLTFSSQASFMFFGAPVPGKIAVTFTSVNQMSYQEQTTYQTGVGNNTCTNPYAGTLTKQ